MLFFLFFFFNDTATTEIYTLSLHDALPILLVRELRGRSAARAAAGSDALGDGGGAPRRHHREGARDRKSTRLNSSHVRISYAVFCLKKKKNTNRVCNVLDYGPSIVRIECA